MAGQGLDGAGLRRHRRGDRQALRGQGRLRLLLDTHAVVWSLEDPRKLAGDARSAVTSGEHPIAVSAASVWEIAIKRATGKLTIPDDLIRALEGAAFERLEITWEHTERAGA
ncbi:MAG: type II toxin-antitoxin system VapC family toxin, partial [Gaiellaceae bacterium]